MTTYAFNKWCEEHPEELDIQMEKCPHCGNYYKKGSRCAHCIFLKLK